MKIYMTVSLLLCGLLNADVLIPACQRANDKNVVVCSETKLGKLIWQDDPKIFNGDWDKAKSYCENLNFAGYSDWRLPTRIELLSITDDSKFNPSINSAFKNVKSRLYWTSTMHADDLSIAWIVSFTDGSNVWDERPFSPCVRCVRQY